MLTLHLRSRGFGLHNLGKLGWERYEAAEICSVTEDKACVWFVTYHSCRRCPNPNERALVESFFFLKSHATLRSKGQKFSLNYRVIWHDNLFYLSLLFERYVGASSEKSSTCSGALFENFSSRMAFQQHSMLCDFAYEESVGWKFHKSLFLHTSILEVHFERFPRSLPGHYPYLLRPAAKVHVRFSTGWNFPTKTSL